MIKRTTYTMKTNSIVRKLPDVVPAVCIAKAKQLPLRNGCSFDEARIDGYTLKGICSELCKINGCEAYEIYPFETMT